MLTFAFYHRPLDDRATSIDSQLEHGLQLPVCEHLFRSIEIGVKAPI
ncbi:hypothetical protein SAMN05444170_5731 [Bradyrhizobium erythrophlei]|uniref:Uncharacterized protein n=1 Tax=Bradyrhizobium erythrophlei TaxID=1437360 RepID=A0A1M7UM31_9BRAD|nr:hypothetical protein SAMN05444170_5731 [Bradyrhizobium erythrophlei]